MPGGFAIILCMPLVGFLLGHTDARRLLFFGLTLLSVALSHDEFRYFRSISARWLPPASFRRSALAFLFVPINTAAYAFLPPGKNNAASGLINLARNIGGSVGISFVTTMLARRAQVHQANLTHRLNTGKAQYQTMIAQHHAPARSRGSSAYRSGPPGLRLIAEHAQSASDHAGLRRQLLDAGRRSLRHDSVRLPDEESETGRPDGGTLRPYGLAHADQDHHRRTRVRQRRRDDRASTLAERLGWKLWDQELTAEIARVANVDALAAHRCDERVDPFFTASSRCMPAAVTNAPRQSATPMSSIPTAWWKCCTK